MSSLSNQYKSQIFAFDSDTDNKEEKGKKSEAKTEKTSPKLIQVWRLSKHASPNKSRIDKDSFDTISDSVSFDLERFDWRNEIDIKNNFHIQELLKMFEDCIEENNEEMFKRLFTSMHDKYPELCENLCVKSVLHSQYEHWDPSKQITKRQSSFKGGILHMCAYKRRHDMIFKIIAPIMFINR